MITDFLISLAPFFTGLLVEVFNGIFGTTAPAFLLSGASKLGIVLDALSSYIVWIPFDELAGFIIGLCTFWLCVWLWRAIKMLVSHVPFIGGN